MKPDLLPTAKGGRCAWWAGKLLVCVLLWAVSLAAFAEDDLVARARSLAFSGKQNREGALMLLRDHLAQAPDDTEARVLYGIVLSWQGRFAEARAQLGRVLAEQPTHADALPAMINVELWSDQPARADELARRGLAVKPDNIDLLLADARALRNLNRPQDALKLLDRVLQLNPANQSAKRMRRVLLESTDRWQASLTHTYEWFSDGRSPQRETSFSFRGPTRVGSLIGTVNRADRYSLVSYQTELDFYPHFRSGTYADVNVGYSADGTLYPTYRAGIDLFQSVGHGLEISGGYRHLAFSSGVNICTFAVGRYQGDWLFTARGFLTPGTPGPSGTALLSARRFLGGEGLHDYFEVRYSHGASPAFAKTLQDIEVLDSSRLVAEFDKGIRGRWFANFEAGIAQEQRIGLRDLRRYTLQGSIYYRF